jgi:hypothetical protein
MTNELPSSSESRAAIFTPQPKPDEAQKTVANLLNDTNAMAEWIGSIEKIRQKESEAQAK